MGIFSRQPEDVMGRNNGQPSWRIRRRFFAYTIAFASSLIVYVIFRWEDLAIATELIAFAASVWLAVLGFYTTGATLEDINLYGKYKRIGENNNESEYSGYDEY
jgi:hypothetical protein